MLAHSGFATRTRTVAASKARPFQKRDMNRIHFETKISSEINLLLHRCRVCAIHTATRRADRLAQLRATRVAQLGYASCHRGGH
jgi:hypothetical protein